MAASLHPLGVAANITATSVTPSMVGTVPLRTLGLSPFEPIESPKPHGSATPGLALVASTSTPAVLPPKKNLIHVVPNISTLAVTGPATGVHTFAS